MIGPFSLTWKLFVFTLTLRGGDDRGGSDFGGSLDGGGLGADLGGTVDLGGGLDSGDSTDSGDGYSSGPPNEGAYTGGYGTSDDYDSDYSEGDAVADAMAEAYNNGGDLSDIHDAAMGAREAYGGGSYGGGLFGDFGDAISDLFGDVSDAFGFGDEQDDVTTTSYTEGGYTVTQTVNEKTGEQTATTINNQTGRATYSVATQSTFGGYDIDTYSSTRGKAGTSYHTTMAGTALSYSYDQHYYSDTNEAMDTLGEMYADISEALGYDYNETAAKALDTLSTVGSYALGGKTLISGLKAVQLGQAFGSKTLTVFGGTTALSGFLSVTEDMQSLNALWGGSTSLNTSIATANFSTSPDGSMTGGSIKNIIAQADKEAKATRQMQAITYTDIATSRIFDKMAGGRIYQGVFAGDMYFDATRAPDTSFSVGKKFTLSSHAIRTHAPYSGFIPKNQAGTKTFHVSKM